MWLIGFLFWSFAVMGDSVEPFQNASISLPSHTKTSTKRPFYVLAHMVNSLPEIDHYLALGANGIETDVYFAPNATPVFTFHGYPCDCFRHCGEKTKIEVFLDRVRELTTPALPHFNSRFTLLFLDLKLIRVPHSAKALAGQNFAQTLLTHLYNETEEKSSNKGSRIKMVISIAHVFDYDFVLGFQSEIEDHGKAWLSRDYVGWDVGMNDPLFAIESMWKRLDVVHNIWQGDGRSNCLSPFYNLGRLSSIVKRRDGPSMFGVKNYIRKVYQWTVDLTVNIRTALRANVDAIITNHPERVLHVLKEREFVNRYRLASGSDSPFERVWTKPARPSTTIRTPTLGLKLVNGAGDMFDSLAKFVGDIIKYKTPVRYFYLSTYAAQQRQREQLREQLTEDPSSPTMELIHQQPFKETQQSGSTDELITLMTALWTRYRQPILDLLHFLLSS